MMRGGWGTDDPTRAAFVFAHALALTDAGHDVQVFLTGEATYLMRKSTVEAVNRSAGRRSASCATRPLPRACGSFPEELAPGPVGSRKRI